MKNKAFTYILIVVVGVVWYQVFLRVKSNFETEDALPQRPLSSITSRKILKPADFQLQANYRDPFTGKLASAENIPVNPNNNPTPVASTAPKPKPQPVIVSWPSIRYFGLVRKTSSKDPRTVIAIDGMIYKVKQGEQVLDNIYIQKVTRDFVEIRYRKETKTFYKQE